MPWIVKALFLLAKSRRGRELFLTAGLGLLELARSKQARKLYATARTTFDDPTVRQRLMRNVRRAGHATRDVRSQVARKMYRP